VVLKEDLQPIVENQQVRKNKRKKLSSIHRLKFSNELFLLCYKTFRRTGVRVKNECCTQMVQRGEEC
jgi:hypothetical protein